MQGSSSSKVSTDVWSYLKSGTHFLDLRVLRSMKVFNQKLLNRLWVNCCGMDHDIGMSDFALANLCFREGILCVENAAAEIIIAPHFGLLWLPPCVASNFSYLCLHFQFLPLPQPSPLNIQMKPPLMNVCFSFYCCFTKITHAHVFIWVYVCFATDSIHTSRK